MASMLASDGRLDSGVTLVCHLTLVWLSLLVLAACGCWRWLRGDARRPQWRQAAVGIGGGVGLAAGVRGMRLRALSAGGDCMASRWGLPSVVFEQLAAGDGSGVALGVGTGSGPPLLVDGVALFCLLA